MEKNHEMNINNDIFSSVHKTICSSMSTENASVKPLQDKDIPMFLEEYFSSIDFYIRAVNRTLNK